MKSPDGVADVLTAKPTPYAKQEVTILIIKLLIVTGLRISELTNLKIRNVATDASQMIVRGKGNKERIVFVPNKELQDAFRQYCIDRAKHGSLKSPLFLNAVGRRLRSQTFRKRLRVLSHRLGIRPHLTPHRFRHSAATLLIEEGTGIRMVQTEEYQIAMKLRKNVGMLFAHLKRILGLGPCDYEDHVAQMTNSSSPPPPKTSAN